MLATSPDANWYHPDATTFGDRLTGAREAAGMSQKDVARRLGVKLKTVKGWEDDLNEPRANKLSMLAGMLNVSLTWLISGSGESPDAPHDAMTSDENLADILRQIGELRAQIAMSVESLERLEQAVRSVALSREMERPIESAAS